ncbi:MAG TPA: hypothetical protein VIL20_19755 [Sandaracinaceae bacterium]
MRTTSATGAWRPEDEALLSRLENEEVLERLWAAVGEGSPPPHPRAAGLVAELRKFAQGRAAVERALRGDIGDVVRLVNTPDPAWLTPTLAHHLALLHARIASVYEKASDPHKRGASAWPRLRSIAMWLWLAEEGSYLAQLGERVAGGALPPPEIARIAADAPYAAIDALGEVARAGARELSEPARVALHVLARIGEAAALAGVGDRVREQAERRAARARGAAVDDALARIDDALEEARARDASTDELVTLFSDARAIWHWSGRDEQVERFLVERVPPFCWDRYRDKRWNELRWLLAQIEEPVEHLARRIERDASKIAYAAPCAQVFVFRAELATSFDGQLALAERAVAICPTHRNGRLVLADLLVERAMRTLDVAMPWAAGDALAKAEKDVRRAEELFPLLKRLPEAKQRLKALGKDLDAA